MRVLFFLRHQGYVRNYQSVLRELVARGHDVHVALDSTRAPWLDGRDPLAAAPGVTSGPAPEFARTFRVKVDRGLRISLDYLRYFDPRYRDSRKLRSRASRRVPAPIKRLPGLGREAVRRPLETSLRLLDRTLPPVRVVDEFIAQQRPDVVLVTPLVAMGSPQVEYIRAARRLGIPSGQCVASWDHLTSKGLVHELPDTVFVWNEAQRDEAVELHGIPEERVAVTGAQCYDHWFEREPSTSREEFCARVGLRPDRPIVLYLCSSPFIAPEEAAFVRRWLAAVRTAEPETGVLVRPHPQNNAQWAGVDLGDAQAAIWPPAGSDPVDEPAQAEYFDSMYHSAAVVGVNTSGLIESAIVGRPVHTILDPAFRETQRGTLHFEHIAGEDGVLLVASSMEEHLEQLAGSIEGTDSGERRRAFLERFVRPFGLDRPATPIFADAVERLASGEPAATDQERHPVAAHA
jgi:hypothetical protein